MRDRARRNVPMPGSPITRILCGPCGPGIIYLIYASFQPPSFRFTFTQHTINKRPLLRWYCVQGCGGWLLSGVYNRRASVYRCGRASSERGLNIEFFYGSQCLQDEELPSMVAPDRWAASGGTSGRRLLWKFLSGSGTRKHLYLLFLPCRNCTTMLLHPWLHAISTCMRWLGTPTHHHRSTARAG